MKILFIIGGKEHTIDRDDRLDKILIVDAAAIQEQRLKEDEAKHEADPKFEIRPVFTTGDYAESLVMPKLDDQLVQEDNRRKAEIAAKFDQVDEKSKIFINALNKWVADRVLEGDTASIQKIVTASGIPIG